MWSSIDRLKKLKKENIIDSVNHVFVSNDKNEFICSIGLEELVISEKDETYKKNIESGDFQYTKTVALHTEDVQKVIEKVSDYNLSVIPVVDESNVLLGRITSDDIYDLIEEMATEDIYQMAGVNAEVEEAEDLIPVVKTRAFWLFVNLITAIASTVLLTTVTDIVGFFAFLGLQKLLCSNEFLSHSTFHE